MKIAGDAELSPGPDTVFERLLDPDLLERCIPGCSALEETAPHCYQARVKVGVGAVKGTFDATFTLGDFDRPRSYCLTLAGRSPVGHARGSARVRLHPRGTGTHLTWEGEANVSGLIAAVGQRLLAVAARRTACRFFDNVAREIG